MNTDTSIHERGNAVTLTLLGLSVAILAGVVVLYFIGLAKPEPVYTPDPADEEVFETVAPKEDPRKGWNTYVNEEYDFSIQYPDGWIVATGTLKTGDPAFSLYQATGTSTDMVYDHFTQTSHVSVYPLGIATEGIRAEMQASDIIIQIPQASAKDYVLQTGRPWATKAMFDVFPTSWNEAGFLFARLNIEEEEMIYMRGDTEIAQHEFDPFTGDHIERTGFVDTNMRTVQKNVLQSFRFLDDQNPEEPMKEKTIEVYTPKDGVIAESPLLVRGRTKDGWYYEDDFTVRLTTVRNDVVTEASVVPQGSVDAQGMIPFEVSLVFDAPAATSGVLTIGNLNNSESTQKEALVTIPIVFAGTSTAGSLQGE